MSATMQRVHKDSDQTCDGGTLSEVPPQVPRDDASTCTTEGLTYHTSSLIKYT